MKLIHIFEEKKVNIKKLITMLCFDDIDKNSIFSTDTALSTITTEIQLFQLVAQFVKAFMIIES